MKTHLVSCLVIFGSSKVKVKRSLAGFPADSAEFPVTRRKFPPRQLRVLYDHYGRSEDEKSSESSTYFSPVTPNRPTTSVRSASCNSEVMERISHYSCCKAELHFNRKCEITFTANETNFAHFKGDVRICTHPCGKLGDGVMRLKECGAVLGVMVCPNGEEMNVVEEKIQYRSPPCHISQAPGNQGSVRLLPMTLMTGVLIVKKLVC